MLNYDFLNGKPIRLQYYGLPFLQQERQNMELGIFAQDAWKIKRMTLNLGLVTTHQHGLSGGRTAGRAFVPARNVEALSGVPRGTTSTRVLVRRSMCSATAGQRSKSRSGRFNQLSRSDLTRRFHPFSSSINTANRTWTDINGNYMPDCDVQNFSAQDLSACGGDICGPMSSVNFGKFIPLGVFDDSVLNDNRDFLWDVNVDVQHELIHGLSVNFGYNHNWDGTFTVTENTAVGPKNFDEFCISCQNDPRLGATPARSSAVITTSSRSCSGRAPCA